MQRTRRLLCHPNLLRWGIEWYGCTVVVKDRRATRQLVVWTREALGEGWLGVADGGPLGDAVFYRAGEGGEPGGDCGVKGRPFGGVFFLAEGEGLEGYTGLHGPAEHFAGVEGGDAGYADLARRANSCGGIGEKGEECCLGGDGIAGEGNSSQGLAVFGIEGVEKGSAIDRGHAEGPDGIGAVGTAGCLWCFGGGRGLNNLFGRFGSALVESTFLVDAPDLLSGPGGLGAFEKGNEIVEGAGAYFFEQAAELFVDFAVVGFRLAGAIAILLHGEASELAGLGNGHRVAADQGPDYGAADLTAFVYFSQSSCQHTVASAATADGADLLQGGKGAFRLFRFGGSCSFRKLLEPVVEGSAGDACFFQNLLYGALACALQGNPVLALLLIETVDVHGANLDKTV
jgi:hypothetical protein